MVSNEILENVIKDKEEAREICILLMNSNYEEDIEKMCFYDIKEKRATNLYFLCNGDAELIHQTIQFIASGKVELKAIHKNLDSKKPKPIINRKKRENESYFEFYNEQIKECWTRKKR